MEWMDVYYYRQVTNWKQSLTKDQKSKVYLYVLQTTAKKLWKFHNWTLGDILTVLQRWCHSLKYSGLVKNKKIFQTDPNRPFTNCRSFIMNKFESVLGVPIQSGPNWISFNMSRASRAKYRSTRALYGGMPLCEQKDWQTHTTENITFQRLPCRAAMKVSRLNGSCPRLIFI